MDVAFYSPQYNPEFLRRVAERRRAEAVVAQKWQQAADLAARLQRLDRLAMRAAAARKQRVAVREKMAEQRQSEIYQVSLEARGCVEKIQARACRVFGVTLAELRSEAKPNGLAVARHFIAYWACRRAGYSNAKTGRLLNRDPSTISHAIRTHVLRRRQMGRYLREAK